MSARTALGACNYATHCDTDPHKEKMAIVAATPIQLDSPFIDGNTVPTVTYTKTYMAEIWQDNCTTSPVEFTFFAAKPSGLKDTILGEQSAQMFEYASSLGCYSEVKAYSGALEEATPYEETFAASDYKKRSSVIDSELTDLDETVSLLQCTKGHNRKPYTTRTQATVSFGSAHCRWGCDHYVDNTLTPPSVFHQGFIDCSRVEISATAKHNSGVDYDSEAAESCPNVAPCNYGS